MSAMLRSALFVARADVAHMLRQRETIAWVFVMPVLFFYFIGTVSGGQGVTAVTGPDLLALDAPREGGFLVDEIVQRLRQQDYQVVRPETYEEMDRYARQLVIPDQGPGQPSFTEAVLSGRQTTLRFVRRAGGPAADFDRVRVTRAVYALLADLAVLRQEEIQATPAALDELAAMPRAIELEVVQAGRRIEFPSGFEQAIPGTMVMFTMLVLLTSGAITLVTERETGLLRRLASTPISRSSVVLGKWTGRMALGLVQIAAAAAAGTILFGMRWGDSLPMVALVLIGWAAFNASFAITLANLARSSAQMAGIGILTAMLLAALGGAWWPIEITPGWMQRLAMFLPTGWVMDAIHQLVSFGYGAGAAVPHLLALVTGALVFGWVGARTFRYQ
jgi:ABC-2 type transport system permease protein